ncbi:hypothetical protein LEP1GSC067_0519 [Leptospira interrogans serovar Lora str. TE 1992]|uniref:Uncharacterized protein n=1 Tax=Leptospira interrogans serovar Lora str. TE 1992 TaxID=1193028 RepID=M3EXA0_LEPIR|nr:hypothetical protein LEP1GSC067_0519 [Leptospira interrogans serovar Lora str. TE 1992]
MWLKIFQRSPISKNRIKDGTKKRGKNLNPKLETKEFKFCRKKKTKKTLHISWK